MIRYSYIISVIVVLAFILGYYDFPTDSTEYNLKSGQINLPDPNVKGNISIEETLSSRRSVRSFKEESLTQADLGQMLWAAQGMTSEWGGRTAPSAGATYPLETYVVVGAVEGIEQGLYRYEPTTHSIRQKISGDIREELMIQSANQRWVGNAPATIILTAVYERTTDKYGERGEMYVHMEAGHAGQNIYLQAGSIRLGTVAIGAFNPDGITRLLELSEGEIPLYLYPVGKIR